MKHLEKLTTAGIVLSMTVILAGCSTTTQGNDRGTKSVSNSTSNLTANTVTVAAPTATNTTANTSNNNAITVSQGNSHSAPANLPFVPHGWYYTNLSTFGKGAQIVGIKQSSGSIDITAKVYESYKSASLDVRSGTLGVEVVQRGAGPSDYSGSWKLKFGNVQYKKPIQITLVHNGEDVFTLPSSVPGYASEIMTDPSRFDNQVIGENGPWVWIAMKGSKTAPFPQMTNGFRYWNRIVAINTETQVLHVYSIPPNTSAASTASNPPTFSHIGQSIYIGTGPWIGVFPAQPGNNSMQVVRPEPQGRISQDQQKMLAGLQHKLQTGADGLANYWNNFIIKGNQQDNQSAWEMDPAYWNHGRLPTSINWAVRFPLKKGSKAYDTRQKLFGQVETLLKNPLDTAWIALDTRQLMKSRYHSTPPAKIPGYVIKGHYYEKVGTPTSSSTSRQNVFVFSQAMLEEIYVVESFRSAGPIFPPQNIANEVKKWAPKVSMRMLHYAPTAQQALDKKLIENIEGPMTLLKNLPGYTLHHAQLPSGSRTYWYPSNNKFPIWHNPTVK